MGPRRLFSRQTLQVAGDKGLLPVRIVLELSEPQARKAWMEELYGQGNEGCDCRLI